MDRAEEAFVSESRLSPEVATALRKLPCDLREWIFGKVRNKVENVDKYVAKLIQITKEELAEAGWQEVGSGWQWQAGGGEAGWEAGG